MPGGLQALCMSQPQKRLTARLPHHPKGLYSPSASVLVTTTNRIPPSHHTVNLHKGERGASYRRGEEKPTRLQKKPPASSREGAGRSQTRAETAERVRSSWTGAGRSAEEPQLRGQPALSDTLRAQPTRSISRPRASSTLPSLAGDEFPASPATPDAPPRQHKPPGSERDVNPSLPGAFLGLQAAMNLEGVPDGGQKENDFVRGPDSPCPPSVTHCDPETRAPGLTCCSCSDCKLTSCFRLPHSLGLGELRPAVQ